MGAWEPQPPGTTVVTPVPDCVCCADKVNSQLPCHIRAPDTTEVAGRLKKYDLNQDGKLGRWGQPG